MRRGKAVSCVVELLEARKLLAVSYSFVDLGMADLGYSYIGTGFQRINNKYLSGNTLNTTFRSQGVRIVGIDPDTALLMNPVSGYLNAAVVDTSETGVSVGRSYKNGDIVATSWTSGKPTNLGKGIANAISPNGKTIVGAIAKTVGILTSSKAYLFGKGAKEIGSLGGRSSSALDVNDSGVIVGTAEDDTGKASPFIYNGKTMTEIAPSYETGNANAISNSGLVVGDVNNHAFIYDSNKRKFSLLPNASIKDSLGTSIAWDVNNSGTAVGYTNRKLGPHATVWSNGVAIDLNAVSKTGYELLYAKSVNDKGQIVVVGQNAKFGGRALLLTPNAAALGSNGTLTVTGSGGADTVAVSVKSGSVKVTVNGATQTFSSKSIKRISVDAGSGNDVITIGAGLAPANIKGGSGNDIFKVRNSNAKDVVDGGAGTDQCQIDKGDSRTAVEKLLA